MILLIIVLAYIFWGSIPGDENLSNFPVLNTIFTAFGFVGSFIGISCILANLFRKPFEELGNIVFFRTTVKNYNEKANFSPEQFEGIFKDFFSKIRGEKYVIVFDNIDRCEPKVAYETLSTIKTFMDVKNCFYIITADDVALKKHIVNFSDGVEFEERQLDDEFIDKIFQTYIRIPLLKEVDRDEFIKEQLELTILGGKFDENQKTQITQILYYAYKGESPRNIKRFINDFSSYFCLIEKIDPKLTQNIVLFTVMISIKQKWPDFEEYLLEDRDFFSEFHESPSKDQLDNYIGDNKTTLLSYLKNINDYFLKSIVSDSFVPYIYLKQCDESQGFSEALKNKDIETVALTDESVKVFINQYKNIFVKGKAFQINAIDYLMRMLSDDLNSKYKQSLLREFWIHLVKLSRFKRNEDNMTSIYLLLLNTSEKVFINILEYHDIDIQEYEIEKILYDFFEYFHTSKEVQDIQVIEEKYKLLIKSERNLFIKRIFANWKLEDEYLNRLITCTATAKKHQYLPENVLKKLLTEEPMSDESLKLIENWDFSVVKAEYKSHLLSLIINKMKELKPKNIQGFKNQEDQIRLLGKLFKNQTTPLLEDSEEQFTDEIIVFVETLFRVVFNNDISCYDILVDYVNEMIYFSGISDRFDDLLNKLFSQYLLKNNALLNEWFEDIRYSENLLQLDKTIKTIMESNSYEAIFSKIIAEAKTEEKDTLKNEVMEILVQKIIEEIKVQKDDDDILKRMDYLIQNTGITDENRLEILGNKIACGDYFKKNPEGCVKIISSLNENNEIEESGNLITEIIKYVINYLNDRLKATDDISKYTIVTDIMNQNTFNDCNALLFITLSSCLDRNQTLEENKFALKIIKNNYELYTNEEKEKITELVNNNDNFASWDSEDKKYLEEKGIINEDKDD